VSLPKSIVQTLGLSVGSKLDLTLEDNRIVLTPSEDGLTLEQLLAGSTKSDFVLNDEDRAWVDAAPVGNEI
jgi:antitoxin component of MazEF toxin-antitoxin module